MRTGRQGKARPGMRAQRTAMAIWQFPADQMTSPLTRRGFQGFGSVSRPGMSETGLTVPAMNEPLRCYTVTVTTGCDGGCLLDPAAFAVAADQAAWSRSASIISAHLADKIISVVTVTAPGRYAAVAVARAVVSDALERQAPSSRQPADDRAHLGAAVRRTPHT